MNKQVECVKNFQRQLRIFRLHQKNILPHVLRQEKMSLPFKYKNCFF